MPLYGYARVSTRDQDLAAQDAELRNAGCVKTFKEKVSGAKTDRPELAKVIRRLEPGDVLVVTRLDRLARSTRDLLNVLAAVADRGAGFKSLKDAWCDTTTPHGRLLTVLLGGIAEFERELIRARINSRSNSARPPSTVSIKRPWALVVSAQASLRLLKPAPRSAIAAITLSRSRVDLASRSSRVTTSTSPGSSRPIAFTSSGRSVLAPDIFSLNTLAQPAAISSAS